MVLNGINNNNTKVINEGVMWTQKLSGFFLLFMNCIFYQSIKLHFTRLKGDFKNL